MGNEITVDASWGFWLSGAIGWTYFLAWSISFYPQVILNWKRKSVKGLSMDFLWYNIYGFACYSVFNIAFFASEEVRKEYQQRNGGNDNLVRVNDVFFGVHALTLSAFTLYQAFIYKDHSNQRISSVALTFIILTLFGAFGLLLRVLTSKKEWIDLLYYLSYIKLAISFIKYLPQARLNYLRKSTIGWSIHNILLDFTGGVLSIVQLILDAYLEDNWDGIKGDPVKFGLGFLSIAFDLIFIVQHYILYRNRQEHEENVIDSEPDWEEPLLKKGRTNVKGDPENRYV